MTWDYVINEANKAIAQLQTFIVEDSANSSFYQEKLAAVTIIRQDAINQQEEAIHATLDKVAGNYHEYTSDYMRLRAVHDDSIHSDDKKEQEESEDTWIR
jgi:hypothetical protein